jgi:CBS domain-containing protein
MQTVGQYLATKGNQVWATRPDASVYEALERMADKDIGSLLVMEGDKLVGIFSERDYARKVILHGKSSKETLVSEIMTSRVAYVRPEQSIEDCMAIMTELHVRHLPVMADEEVIGVISIGDVVKSIISEQSFTIKQLENYITSGR